MLATLNARFFWDCHCLTTVRVKIARFLVHDLDAGIMVRVQALRNELFPLTFEIEEIFYFYVRNLGLSHVSFLIVVLKSGG